MNPERVCAIGAPPMGVQPVHGSPEDNTATAALIGLGRLLQSMGYRFTTVTPATHARVNGRPGNAWAETVEDVFGWSRPARAGVLPAPVFAAAQGAGVLVAHAGGWRSAVRASTLDECLFFHSAYPTTSSDAVFFGPDTYRFAAAIGSYLDTERRPIRRAVDIGAGTGMAAILIARARPGAEAVAVDINDATLRFTAVNAALAGVERVLGLRSDLLTAVDGSFDLIVANPPYLLDPGERVYRHGGGGWGEGLSLRIAELACSRLTEGGTLLLYTGAAIVHGSDRFRMALEAQLAGSSLDWRYREIDPDVFGEELLEPAYADADRIAAVLVTVTRPQR